MCMHAAQIQTELITNILITNVYKTISMLWDNAVRSVMQLFSVNGLPT